jgi:hypothetical protein
MASKTSLSITSNNSLKRDLDINPWTQSKRAKTLDVEGGGKRALSLAEGRKLFLGHLRATCERYSSKVDLGEFGAGPIGRVEGLDILRLFLRDVLAKPEMSSLQCEVQGKKFPLSACSCRHKIVGVPSGLQPCYTGGIKDNKKAQAFVMEDFRIVLLKWLRAHLVDSTDTVSDVEEMHGEEVESEEDNEPSQATSFIPSDYPSSPFLASDRKKKRVTTKQRLVVLQYLRHHSQSFAAFRVAYKALCDPNVNLLHLCGCGISDSEHPNGCVTGSHLKLASQELNRDHVHVHFTLKLASSREKYLQMLESLKGGKEGVYDDVF